MPDNRRSARRFCFVPRKSPQALLLATRLLPVNLTDDAKFECSMENGFDGAARATMAAMSDSMAGVAIPSRCVSNAACPDCPDAGRERSRRAAAVGRPGLPRRLRLHTFRLGSPDLPFSNPKLPLLEPTLSHWKQTTATHSNRNFLRLAVLTALPAFSIIAGLIPHKEPCVQGR
jgi:hypothetical protein